MGYVMDDALVSRNIEAQRELYGESLGDAFRRLMAAFGLTQGQLASTVGLSAPMLSQLMTAQRVKIGNPGVLQRLEALGELADQIADGRILPDAVATRLAQIPTVTGRLTRTERSAVPSTDEELVAIVRGLLRAVASGQELRDAVEVLRPAHPGIAALVEAYGLGPSSEALAHFQRHRDLL